MFLRFRTGFHLHPHSSPQGRPVWETDSRWLWSEDGEVPRQDETTQHQRTFICWWVKLNMLSHDVSTCASVSSLHSNVCFLCVLLPKVAWKKLLCTQTDSTWAAWWAACPTSHSPPTITWRWWRTLPTARTSTPAPTRKTRSPSPAQHVHQPIRLLQTLPAPNEWKH